jgi:hypothetical protein
MTKASMPDSPPSFSYNVGLVLMRVIITSAKSPRKRAGGDSRVRNRLTRFWFFAMLPFQVTSSNA